MVINKLDILDLFLYLSIVKVVGFFLLTMIFIEAASSGERINPIALTQSEPPFCLRCNMKAAHHEHLFIEDVKKGYFRIDEDGRIWRIAMRGWKRLFIKIQEREMKTISNNGYIHIVFWKNGKNYRCLAHRIVWIYFNGEIPDDLEMNHINGIKADNRLENLELVTASGNRKHAYRIGLRHNKKGGKHPLVQGEKHGQAKLTNGDIKEIRNRCEDGETQTAIAKDFDVTQQQISYIVNRKQWRHIF